VKFDKRSFDKFLLVNFKINKLREAPPIPIRYANTIQNIKLDDQGLDLFTDKSANPALINKNNLIGFCPGARHFTKRWLKEYFIEFGNKLVKSGYSIVLFVVRIKKFVPSSQLKLIGAINLSNDDDLLQTAADINYVKRLFVMILDLCTQLQQLEQK
jgi:ADP-heptose:LPS heptosyltransferase